MADNDAPILQIARFQIHFFMEGALSHMQSAPRRMPHRRRCVVGYALDERWR